MVAFFGEGYVRKRAKSFFELDACLSCVFGFCKKKGGIRGGTPLPKRREKQSHVRDVVVGFCCFVVNFIVVFVYSYCHFLHLHDNHLHFHVHPIFNFFQLFCCWCCWFVFVLVVFCCFVVVLLLFCCSAVVVVVVVYYVILMLLSLVRIRWF